MEECATFKEEGSNAWSRGDFQDALDKWGLAVQVLVDNAENLVPRERKEQLKILHSNRSGAYLKLNKASDALEEATKCCALDSEWPKGFLRKGDALYALARYTDCFNAYNSALRITPNDRAIQEKCEAAQRAIRSEASSSWSPNTNTGNTALAGVYVGSPSSLIGRVVMAAKLIVVLLAVFCFVPILGRALTSLCHRIMLSAAALSYTLCLYSAHGFPAFNMNYAQSVATDPTAIGLFLVITQFLSRPYLLAILPLFLTETLHVSQHASKVLQSRIPSLLRQTQSIIDSSIHRVLTPEEAASWPRLAASDRWCLITTKTAKYVAWSEVLQAGFLMIELLLPTRNFILLYLWCQYLRMRYMMDTSGNMRGIFIALDQNIMGLLASYPIPAVVKQGYGLLKDVLQKQVDMSAQGTGGGGRGGLGGMLSRCSIM